MVIPVSKPKVSQSEKKYREDTFPDVKEIKNKNLLCTSCGGSVNELIKKGKAIIHPFLETLLCEKCNSFYGDGQFSVDEDGSDKYCRWCGQGGTLFLCSQCTSGFCKKCVKRNLPKSAQSKIEEDDWVCYCCDTSPLYELRAQGWAALQYAADYVKNKGSSKTKKNSKESSKRSRHSAGNSDSEEEVHAKKKRKEVSKKKNEKRQRNGEEKDGTRGGRTLRNRMSKAGSESGSDDHSEMSSTKTLPGGVRSESLHAAVHRLTSFVSEIASMTKETHKKLLECKNRKLSVKNISTVASLYDVRKKLSSMMLALETHVHNARIGIEDFMQEWSKTALSDLKVKGLEGEMMMEYLEMLENGSLPKEGMEDAIKDKPEAMEVCGNAQKENESDEESNKFNKKIVEDEIKKDEDNTDTNDDQISNSIKSEDNKNSTQDKTTEIGNNLTDEEKPEENEKSSTDTKSEQTDDKKSEDSRKSTVDMKSIGGKKAEERKKSTDDKKLEKERIPTAEDVEDKNSNDKELQCKSSGDAKASSSSEIGSSTNESDPSIAVKN